MCCRARVRGLIEGEKAVGVGGSWTSWREVLWRMNPAHAVIILYMDLYSVSLVWGSG